MSLVTNNSIGWACLQISGGWKRIAWVCAVIGVAVPLFIFGSLQLTNGRTANLLTGWYTMLGIVQGGLIGFGIPSRVHAAIKRDRVSKLIESHRLMPTPAGHAIAGYIVGANLFLICCIATLFVVGLIVSIPAEQDWRGWISLHIAAAGVAATLCCFVAFSSQWLPKLNPALFSIMFGPALGALSATALPPLRVLMAPYLGNGLAAMQRGEVTGSLIVSVSAQVLLSAIFFIGACRRYRRDDVPALGFGWGFALLALWIALTLIGILSPDSRRVGALTSDASESMAYIVAVVLTMLLAVGPISSSATAAFRWARRRKADAYFIDRRPLPSPLAATLVGLIVLALLLAAPRDVGSLFEWQDRARSTPIHLWLTGATIVLFIVTVAGLARAAARMRIASAWIVTGWLFLMWVVPPAMDGLYAFARGDFENYPHAFSAISAPFGLGQIWSNHTDHAKFGLIVQGILLIVLVAGWTVLKRSNTRSNAKVLGQFSPEPQRV